MMKIIYQSFLVVLLYTVAVTSEDSCSKKVNLVTVTICPEEYSEYCCNKISLHNGSVSIKNFRCEGSWATDISCRPGFYLRNNTTVSCPRGFFCPGRTRCIVPCNSGAFCPGYELAQNSTICKHPERSKINPSVVNGVKTCPGEGSQAMCVKGFYCPTAWEKKPCPPGKRCFRGFSYPLRCNLFGECDFMAGAQMDDLRGIILLAALLFVVIVAKFLKFKLRKRSILIREEVPDRMLEMRRRAKSKSNFNIPTALWSSIKVNITQYRESLPKVQRAFTVRAEGLTFTLKSGRKLLRGADLTFQHSKLNVVMGPSGCGKSTLINSLMGYNKDYGDISGNIYLNGVEISNLSEVKNYVGYVTQHDVMHDNLTVKEILTYQAQLKLLKETSEDGDFNLNQYVTSSVTEVINLLALNQIGDRVVGSLDDNLISGGQRRRLSIGMELITNPSILILDEPTSGLDSATALIIMQLLRNLAEQIHINTICVIHQPRIELFELFDNLTLLTGNGRVAYNAEARLIKDYFERLGFRFPVNANPADIIIDILSGFLVSEELEVRHLYKNWRKEQAKRELSSTIDLLDGVDGSSNTSSVIDLVDRVNPRQLDRRQMKSGGYFDQMIVMLHREAVGNIRSFNQSLAEIVVAFILGLGMAFLFRKSMFGNETTKVNLEVVTIGLLVSVSSLRTFGRERSIFLREAKSGVHTLSYFFAKMFMHLPTICFFIPTAFVGIYWTGGDFKGSFGFSYLLFTLAAFAASGISYLISVICTTNLANLISIGVTLIASMFAGCTLTICDLDSLAVIGPILYTISYAKWFVQAQLVSEWSLYDETSRNYFNQRYWANKYLTGDDRRGLWVLFGIGIIFRVLTILVLFYEKSNIAIFHSIRLFLRRRRDRRTKKEAESKVSMGDFTKKEIEMQTLLELKARFE